MQFGRNVLYTDVKKVDKDNIAEILRQVMPYHETNANDIKFLLDYEAGLQEKFRTKKYRPEIDCWCVDNIANEVTEFKLSFNWGNPITLAMRDRNDGSNREIADGIFELNKFYDLQGNRSKQQELARYVEIGGVGYTFVDINTDYVEGESPFTVDVLDSRCAFIVRSSYYLDKRPMLGVSYYCDEHGQKQFTCFTKEARYDLNSSYEHLSTSGELNPLGMIPIIEWVRSHDRMGCFERQISEMDNLNLLISDFTNDVEQNTQAIWHTNDVEFPKQIIKLEDGTEKEVIVKPKGNDWMQTFTSPDGKTPTVKPLAIDYDYNGMLQNITTRRALILQKCNVPSRNDNSGGSTGIAMSDATGWTQAETEANRQDQIKDVCKLNEVKLVLKAVEKCAGFPLDNPIRKLVYSDVEANMPRQKTYELTTKVNAICAMIAKGFSLEDTLSIAPLFEDNNQVIVRSGEGVKKYQESQVFKDEQAQAEEKRPFPDYSDQENQSPQIDGMKTKQ